MKKNSFKYILLLLAALIGTLLIFLICVIFGSTGLADLDFNNLDSVLLEVRLPRVINVALIGASLSICGATMQGLLKNPLADGTTLGVSSGASLGAVISIVLSSSLINFASQYSIFFTIIFSMLAAFLTLMLIISITYKFDSNLSSNTIILVGIVFSMFASSIISLLVSLFPDSAKTVSFWTMGSVAGASFINAAILAIFFIVCSIIIFTKSTELDILTTGEENASHLGVNVKRTKVLLLVCSSALIGVCVSVSGTIAFVGLVVPHISRLIVGARHKSLIPFSVFFGSSFLMLTDLISRTIISPRELPIGVITSLIGAIVFTFVFFRQKRRQKN